MPARIYALAKELNLDSKDLVAIVKKAGITGKGSALASLTDEEAQKVREHLAEASSAQPAKPTAPAAAPVAVRESLAKDRKPIAIKVGRSSGPKRPASGLAQPEPPTETATEAATTTIDNPIAASAAPTSQKGGLASRIASRMGVGKTASTGSDSVAPIRRDPTVAGGGKVRSLDRPASGEKKNGDSAKAKRREPRINVKMASLPELAESKPKKPAAGDQKAQKPDVKLSPDVIAGHRQGMRAPLDQLKEDTDKKRAATAKRGGLSGFTGEKSRRGAEESDEDEKRRKKLAGMAGTAPNGRVANCEAGSRWTSRDSPASRRIANTAVGNASVRESIRRHPEKMRLSWNCLAPSDPSPRRPAYPSVKSWAR